jgi:hypothetical protein
MALEALSYNSAHCTAAVTHSQPQLSRTASGQQPLQQRNIPQYKEHMQTPAYHLQPFLPAPLLS